MRRFKRPKTHPYGTYQFKSTYEMKQAQRLDELGVAWSYESKRYPLYVKVPGARFIHTTEKGMQKLASGITVYRASMYTPDFFIGKTIVETKGRLDDRSKRTILAMIDTHPTLDYRVVFQRDTKLNLKRTPTYSAWAEYNEICYAIGDIPEDWLP